MGWICHLSYRSMPAYIGAPEVFLEAGGPTHPAADHLKCA